MEAGYLKSNRTIRMILRNKKLFLVILVAAAAGISVLLLGGKGAVKSKTGIIPEVEKKNNVADAYVSPRKFGLPTDSFNVIENTVHRNEFLATILQPYNVENITIANLAQKSKPVFDVRRIAAGNQYTIFCTKDSVQKAVYFVYQPNAIDYIIYDLRDSITVTTGKREVTTKIETASGTITSSLYEALEAAGADPALTMKLDDIYAWTIDFYIIKQGDFFKVIYEQRYVKDQPVETGQVKSAIFSHEGDTFYAFYYEPDSLQAGDYFDHTGQSLDIRQSPRSVTEQSKLPGGVGMARRTNIERRRADLRHRSGALHRSGDAGNVGRRAGRSEPDTDPVAGIHILA